MRREAVLAAVCALAVVAVSAAPVAGDDVPTPGARSASSAILGAESWYCGALPPPGFHFLDYALYYRAHELKGQQGGHVSAPPFSDYEVEVFANVFRMLYVSDATILGASPAWHVVVPVVYKSQKSDSFDDSMTGVGDIYISPLILGWHSPPWHYVAALDVIAPTGRYSRHDVTTIGNNHWTFEPAFAMSYIGQSGFCASAKLMYDFHTEDTSLEYEEGEQFHLDYNIGYSFGENRAWKAGICGYYLTSMEEDKLRSSRIGGSQEKVFAIGPTVAYQKDNLLLEAKVQREFEAENRPEGTAMWLRLTYSF